jgi:hypothetical protein
VPGSTIEACLCESGQYANIWSEGKSPHEIFCAAEDDYPLLHSALRGVKAIQESDYVLCFIPIDPLFIFMAGYEIGQVKESKEYVSGAYKEVDVFF